MFLYFVESIVVIAIKKDEINNMFSRKNLSVLIYLRKCIDNGFSLNRLYHFLSGAQCEHVCIYVNSFFYLNKRLFFYDLFKNAEGLFFISYCKNYVFEFNGTKSILICILRFKFFHC